MFLTILQFTFRSDGTIIVTTLFLETVVPVLSFHNRCNETAALLVTLIMMTDISDVAMKLLHFS